MSQPGTGLAQIALKGQPAVKASGACEPHPGIGAGGCGVDGGDLGQGELGDELLPGGPRLALPLVAEREQVAARDHEGPAHPAEPDTDRVEVADGAVERAGPVPCGVVAGGCVSSLSDAEIGRSNGDLEPDIALAAAPVLAVEKTGRGRVEDHVLTCRRLQSHGIPVVQDRHRCCRELHQEAGRVRLLVAGLNPRRDPDLGQQRRSRRVGLATADPPPVTVRRGKGARQPAQRWAAGARLGSGGIYQRSLLDGSPAQLCPLRVGPQPGLGLAADQHVMHGQDQGRRAIAAPEPLLVAREGAEAGTPTAAVGGYGQRQYAPLAGEVDRVARRCARAVTLVGTDGERVSQFGGEGEDGGLVGHPPSLEATR